MARAPGGGSGGGTKSSIFVGNLPYDAQEDELREIFAKVGSVTSVRVVCDKETKQPKGYAFCDFADTNAVQAAVEKLNNVEYNGRKLRIDWAERELHGPSSGARAIGDRDRDDGPGPPPRRGGAGAPPPIDTSAPLQPVQTVADRLARLRDQEAAEQAKHVAAENAERAEIGRLMETLTPQQVIHFIAEMQRLTLRAPEVARALLTENQQLALALQHAEFLAGMIDDAPVPTEPEVRERARSVREKIWGTSQAPAPPHPSMRSAQGALTMQPGMLALPPGMAAPAAVSATHLVPFGTSAPASVFGASPTMGFMQTPMPPVAQQPSVVPVVMAATAAPATVAPATVAPGAAAAPSIPPAVLSQVLGAAGSNEASRQNLMDQLSHLSPAEIDRLPHDVKVQLLDFLQQAPRE